MWSLHGGSSNSDIHQQRYEVIKKWQKNAQRAGKRERQAKPFPVLVDPQNPDNSILFHDISMLMKAGIPFGLVFAMIGFGLFIAGAMAKINELRRLNWADLTPAERRRVEGFPDDGILQIPYKKFIGKICLLTAILLGVCSFLSVFHIIFTSESHVPLFAQMIIWAFSIIFPGFLLGGICYEWVQFRRRRAITVRIGTSFFTLGNTFNARVFMDHRINFPADQDYFGTVALKFGSVSFGQSTQQYLSSVWEQTCNITTDILREDDNGHSFLL